MAVVLLVKVEIGGNFELLFISLTVGPKETQMRNRLAVCGLLVRKESAVLAGVAGSRADIGTVGPGARQFGKGWCCNGFLATADGVDSARTDQVGETVQGSA